MRRVAERLEKEQNKKKERATAATEAGEDKAEKKGRFFQYKESYDGRAPENPYQNQMRTSYHTSDITTNDQRHTTAGASTSRYPTSSVGNQDAMPVQLSHVGTRPSQRRVVDGQVAESNEEHALSPQELLERKLNNPDMVLTPDQSIPVMSYGAQLGEQSAASAANKTVAMVVGNTGAGKSTSSNAWLGCRMKTVRLRELGLSGTRRVVIVDPDSSIPEVMPIGHHSRQSQTFLPQIVQTPGDPNSVYCDCPGFSDTRGAEINIANAINIRKVLRQARGVKAVFLASYNGLVANRGRDIQAMEKMCLQMFGSVDNLIRYQNAVLLGITKAPIYEDDEPTTRNTVRGLLTDTNSPIAQILANRIFLFDPLDRGGDNPDFWSIARCRTEIERLDSIPQQEAATLFQTALTNSDHRHLLTTVRRLRPKITQAIAQGNDTALAQHWQLLQQLHVIEPPEVEQLMQGEVLPAINVALEQFGDIARWTEEHNFDQAEDQIAHLTRLIQQLPGAALDINVAALRQHLAHHKAQYEEQQDAIAERERLQRELAQLEHSERESAD